MRFEELKLKIKTPVFTSNDLSKLFPKEFESHINTQIHRMLARGDLLGLKRGVYVFTGANIDEFVLANKLYSPSYVSLESALNNYGLIPDVAASVTSVSPITSKKFSTPKGTFLYSKINKNLFFGFENKTDENGNYYQIALPEKALLDYIYIRKINNLAESRVDVISLNKRLLLSFSSHFPRFVGKVIEK